MGTIITNKGKYGTTYRAQVCVKKQRESATFDKKSEAEAWIEDTEHLLRTGQPLPGQLPDDDMDFIEAVKRYQKSAGENKKANTRRLDEEIGNRLTKYFGGKTIQTIRSDDIAAYRDYRLRKVGPSSIIQDMSFLSCLYEMARLEWRLDVKNPEKDVKRPAPPNHRNVLLKLDEITRLLDYCCISKSKNLYCYVLLSLQTAMRPGEGAGLLWEQVDLDDYVLDLTETKTEPRRVPLNRLAYAHLKHMEENREKDNPWVFLPKETKPDRPDPSRYFRRSFENAVKSAGVRHITLYGLRHCAGSYLIINGVDIRYVAEIMGHRSISQTMKYTHFLDEHKRQQAQALESIV